MPSADLVASSKKGSRTKTAFWLVAIIAVFLGTICWLHPTETFGGLEDDAIYFTSALAIARGWGYKLPSFPAELLHPKYPPLFPWLLSFVWHSWPSFPQNLVLAQALSTTFGVSFLVLCYVSARRIFGSSRTEALAVTALAAFNLFTLYTGAHILTDLAFASLVLLAAVWCERAVLENHFVRWTLLAGTVAGLATGLRTLGIAVTAGIALHLWLARRHRHAILAGATGLLFALWWLFPMLTSLSSPKVVPPGTLEGWHRLNDLYGNYSLEWKDAMRGQNILPAILAGNAWFLALEPGMYLLTPLATGRVWASVLFGLLYSMLSWFGAWLLFREKGRNALHCILLAHVPIVLLWPYPPQRFLIPFEVVFFTGLMRGMRSLLAGISSPLPQSPRTTTSAGWLKQLPVYAFLVPAAINPIFVVRSLKQEAVESARLLQEKQQAYQWIVRHTAPQARFIAHDDVLLYLYTGRKAVRSLFESPAEFYTEDDTLLCRDLQHLADTAQAIQADYWVIASDDFSRAPTRVRQALQQREVTLTASTPQVFQSTEGHIRIFALPPHWSPPSPPCP